MQELLTQVLLFQKLLSQFLDQLSDFLGIGVVGQPELELHHHPVARVVRQVSDLPERDRVQRPHVVTELHRAHRYLLDRTFDGPQVDVFAPSEGVVDQEEHTGEDVGDELLRAKADRDPDDARTREQRQHLHSKGAQQSEDDDHAQHHQEHHA